MTEREPPSPPSKGPIALARLYLTRRAPAALATDGVLLLLLAVLVGHLWGALYSTLDPVMMNRPSDSLLAAATRPNALFSTLHLLLSCGAWIVLGWAGVRAVSDAVRSRSVP